MNQPATTKCPSYLLSLAGEHRVCSEINRRGALATLTHGNHKSTDLYVISPTDRRAFRVEVKTTQKKEFPTTFPKDGYTTTLPPDFWVFFQSAANSSGAFLERFFILTHAEMVTVQKGHNADYARKHSSSSHAYHDGDYQSLYVNDLLQHENAWHKIVERLQKGCPITQPDA